MAVFSQEQKAWIVTQLARYSTPREICSCFGARFTDTVCIEADVLATDPRVAVLDPDLHLLFERERERALSDDSLAPFAEQRARMIVLSRLVDAYLQNNQPDLARAVMRQIAEEMGEVGGGKAGKPDKSDALPEVKKIEVVHTIVDPKSPSAP